MIGIQLMATILDRTVEGGPGSRYLLLALESVASTDFSNSPLLIRYMVATEKFSSTATGSLNG